jgi:hypothetical protein
MQDEIIDLNGFAFLHLSGKSSGDGHNRRFWIVYVFKVGCIASEIVLRPNLL